MEALTWPWSVVVMAASGAMKEAGGGGRSSSSLSELVMPGRSHIRQACPEIFPSVHGWYYSKHLQSRMQLFAFLGCVFVQARGLAWPMI